MNNENPIYASIFDPRKSIFKSGKSQNAEMKVTYCSAKTCELRNRGQCCTSIFGWTQCPHGRDEHFSGPTTCSQTLDKWIKDHQAKFPNLKCAESAPHKMAVCGDYVYLPYHHANLNNPKVPFLREDNLFVSGVPFIKKEHWNAQVVIALIDHRPHALGGGEITSYQKEEVPKIIAHVKELFPDLWKEVMSIRPDLASCVVSYIGRKAYLITLAATKANPITIGPYHNDYPVVWTYDGETLTTTSKNAYYSTWGNLDDLSCKLTATPGPKTVVVIKEESWVNEKTQFAD